MHEFVMPSLGADMEEGTLVEWHFKVGDKVQRGNVIAEIETEKGVIEVEVWEDGVIEQFLVGTGTTVAVGTPLALIRPIGEAVEASVAAGEQQSQPAHEPIAVTEHVPQPAMQSAEPRCEDIPIVDEAHPMDHRPLVAKPPHTNGKQKRRIKASPVAKRLAKKLGVDLATIVGSGPNGVICKEDVQKAQERAVKETTDEPSTRSGRSRPQTMVEAPAVTPKAKTKKAAQKPAQLAMRQAIAKAMARSNRDIPHYYLETTIDMLAAQTWLEAENAQRSLKERILPAVLLVKATALALNKVPDLNGFWLDDRLQIPEAVNIGFAIALRRDGLVTPALFSPDVKSLDEIMADMRDLIMRTRSGKLRGSELTEATITLTNLGDLGVEKVFGVIYPPQVGLVGFGRISDQPYAINGMLTVRADSHRNTSR